MKTLDDIKDQLSEQELIDLQKIAKRIKATCQVRMIILYGSHARGEQIDESYISQGKKSDYDILVIPMGGGTNLRKQVRHLLRNLFHDIDKTVQCTVEPIEFVNHCLKEGQYFYTDIKNEGVMLHKRGKIELEEQQELSPQRELEIAEHYFKYWSKEAEKHYWTFEQHCEKGKEDDSYYKNATFHMQQCCEACYKCVELVLTRYTPAEHLLVELRKIVVKLDERMNIPFPIDTAEQKKDFDLMDYAYIDSRYDPLYAVLLAQLKYWQGEAQKLMEIVKMICQEHIQNLKNKG